MIPRLIHLDLRFASREYLESPSLERFLPTLERIPLERYRASTIGIVVQEDGWSTVQLVNVGEYVLFTKSGETLCRWHTGPIHEKDDPLKREYCVKKAVTTLGYCNEHRESVMAIYSYCFESSSQLCLTKCRELDEKLKNKVEYVTYLLTYSLDGFKVGSTRRWRFHIRLSEQPHVAAIAIQYSGSAYRARELEIKIGKLEGLSEKPHRDIHKTIVTPIANAVYKLAKIRDKVVEKLGLTSDEKFFIRVEPGLGLQYFYRAKQSSLEQLVDKKLEFIDYFYGYLLLGDPNTNDTYLLKIGEILGKNLLKPIG